MARKDTLKKGMIEIGGLDALIRPTNTPASGTPEKPKRVHCNSVMDGEIHQRMKITATRKGIRLADAIEAACLMYLEKEENK